MTKMKNKKNTSKTKKGTLDQKHTEKIVRFEKINNSLPVKKQKLIRLENELNDLVNMNPNKCSREDIRRKAHLMDTIHKLRTEIFSIENCTESLNYIVKTYPILVDYYDNDEIIEDGMEEELVNVTNETGKKNILSYFMKETTKVLDAENKIQANINNNNILIKKTKLGSNSTTLVPTKKIKLSETSKLSTESSENMEGTENMENAENTENTEVTNIDTIVTESAIPNKQVSRAKLYDNYLNATDFNHKKTGQNKSIICSKPGCGGEKILSQNDGYMVCKKCGLSETSDSILLATDKPSYKEPTQDSGTYAYKRINHLTEILSQLQAKESTDIPPKVFESILRELKKRKIDKNDLDIFRLRRILKKLNYRKYYEHVPHILQIINGKEPPNFTRADEMKIKKMFKQIQKPFAVYCPKNRKNFLNYSYVLHKFCELLDLDEYISYFPLLKNNSKLLQHDKIWKNICGYVHWKFYKSL